MSAVAPHAKSDLHRNVADFEPSVWRDYFVQYASESMEVDKNNEAQFETLKNDVREMLVSEIEDPLENVHLIDSICRLGVKYHFDNEIEEVLHYIYRNYVENEEITIFEDNLCSLAVLFRLLRQQGLYVSPNVFKKFKDEQGNFSERFIKNFEGVLSLYEATHLMIPGEDLLEEALAFTTTHLESIVNQLSHSQAIHVKNSLRYPLHRNLPRLEARSYISIYEQVPSHNENLLIFAKLDFNKLQRLHQKEFGNICKWWKEIDLPNKLPYVRDRIVECCVWALAVFFEPHYSTARKIITKQFILMTVVDDTYDAYGTIDELELFTKAIERWDISCLDILPDYMKYLYRKILDQYKEIEEIMRNEGRAYTLNYYVKEFVKYVQSYMTEAKWLNRIYQPTLEEYIQTSTESSGYALLTTTCFIGMGDTATEDIFKWISNETKMINGAIVVGRILNDIVTNEFEHKREHISSFLECYMRKYNVSKEAAIQEGRKRIADAWNNMNKECLKPTEIPMPFLACLLNLSRFIDVVYKDGDSFTHPGGEMKTFVKALLVDPVPV